LGVEELESRQLLSATGLEDLWITPAESEWVAVPEAVVGTPTVGLTPAQVRRAYGFDQITFTANGQTIQGDGAGQTIAIVAAYDHPYIHNDLQVFSQTFGLPMPPSFVKATPQGQPATNSVWAREIALDVQWAHAIAPMANILLVEALSNSVSNMLAAVDYARNQPGVVVVSMSWGAGEFSSERNYNSRFTTPAGHIGGSGLPGGITFVAASGDTGARTKWPAVSPNVLAVGGTRMTVDSSGNFVSETGWGGSGGGNSVYEPRPSWQATVSGARRGNPDVAYNADPLTGVSVYNTVPNSAGNTGWFKVGGTSAGAPQWAGLLAIAAQGRAYVHNTGSLGNSQVHLYSLPATDFHDTTTGSTRYATTTYYATPGWDYVTGWGTPYANLVVSHLAAAGITLAGTSPSGGSQGPSGGSASPAAEEAPPAGERPDSEPPASGAVLETVRLLGLSLANGSGNQAAAVAAAFATAVPARASAAGTNAPERQTPPARLGTGGGHDRGMTRLLGQLTLDALAPLPASQPAAEARGEAAAPTAVFTPDEAPTPVVDRAPLVDAYWAEEREVSAVVERGETPAAAGVDPALAAALAVVLGGGWSTALKLSETRRRQPWLMG
jgi:hypothetical protein